MDRIDQGARKDEAKGQISRDGNWERNEPLSLCQGEAWRQHLAAAPPNHRRCRRDLSARRSTATWRSVTAGRELRWSAHYQPKTLLKALREDCAAECRADWSHHHQGQEKGYRRDTCIDAAFPTTPSY